MAFKNKQIYFQSGFTLIEALIAFVIAAIGLIGAAMFQSQLIAESGNSKTKMVATKLAEDALEERRTLLLSSEYDGLSASSYSVASENTQFLVSYSITDITSASAAFNDHKQIDVSVSWTDPRGDTDSVSISSLQVWIDPALSLENNTVAGTGQGEGIAAVSRPDGAAVAITRQTLQLTDASVIDTASAAKGRGDYIELSDDKFGIKVNDSELVTVIKRVKSSSEIMEIRGRVYLYTGDGALETPDFAAISATPNVLTSEGGGCAVFEETDGGQVAYTCLFGEGWYGTIALDLQDSGGNVPDDSVCLSPRSYKYYRVNAASVAAGADYADSIVGQGGLVRFTEDDGDGPYIASSNASPGLAYYYLDAEVSTSTALASNPSGNIYNQNFVITGEKSSISGSETYFTSLVDDCKHGTGGDADKPLYQDGVDYDPPHIVDGEEISNEDYFYYNGASSVAEVPSEEVILGYVNAAYEIKGTIYLSNIAASLAASSASATLEPELEAVMDPLPVAAEFCDLDANGDEDIIYTCFVDHGWSGTISVNLVSGSAYSYTITPSSWTPPTGSITEDTTGGNFYLYP